MPPRLTPPSFDLALQHHQAGRMQEAEQLYLKILERYPAHAGAMHYLGLLAHQQGRSGAAVEWISRAIALQPNFARLHYDLANALKADARTDDAIAAYRQAIALDPNFPEACNNLGNVLRETGEIAEAISLFQQAIALKPGYAIAHCNLGNTLSDDNQLDQAVAAYRRAIALDPNLAEACSGLGEALRKKGELDEAIAAFRRALALKPGYLQAHDNLLFALHYHPAVDAASIGRERRLWNQHHALPLQGLITPHQNDRDPDRRLRIGYVSPDLCEHAVGAFLLPLLQNHDRGCVEVLAYAQVPSPDGHTSRLREHTDGWRSIVGLSDADAANLIRQDGIDILIDLALHTASNRLLIFACKPAPVQATYLAYAGSSGLTTMDYRLSDPYLDPPGEDESFYSERTLRLPETYWCYQPVTDLPVGPPPALASGFITFGCLNNFCKVNEPLLVLWARLLRAVPSARLVLHAPEGSARERSIEIFRREGVQAGRVEFVGRLSLEAYFARYHSIDIALDTLPYGGGTTSCDALFMGVPVVSLIGKTAVGRAGASILSNMGLAELLAWRPDDYVQIAAELANDLPRFTELRSGMRARMQRSPLMDGARFARNMEAAYREMWRRWCATASATA